MRFIGASNYDHGTQPKIGVLLTNLGTPEAPTAKALRPYLKQFLWDPRVVEVPRLLWWMILHAFILTTRPKKSAEAYSEVWTDRGSPLLYHLEDQVAGVAERLQAHWGDNIVVKGAMRYGQPSIGSQVQALLGKEFNSSWCCRSTLNLGDQRQPQPLMHYPTSFRDNDGCPIYGS